MKRVNGLFRRVHGWRNLLLAAALARRGKRHRQNVARFEFDQETELLALQRELRSGTYCPGPFRTFVLFEPKRREISVAPYRDRVLHHALCNVLTPVFEPTFTRDSYACRVGKGTHAAVSAAKQLLRKFPCVLKADIARFFPTVDHGILLAAVARKIKDHELLRLVETVVRHPFPAQQPCPFFPGDNLFTRLERPCGLPIGNQTSQFLGNVMLNGLDHFVREELRAPGYVRYVDDFLVFGRSTTELHAHRLAIEAYLATQRLRLNFSKTIVSRSHDGVRFLGFLLRLSGAWLTRSTRRRFRQRLRSWQRLYAQGELSQAEIGQRLAGWLGHVGHARCEPWLTRVLDEHPFCRRAHPETLAPTTD